jgi:hypothetical protein
VYAIIDGNAYDVAASSCAVWKHRNAPARAVDQALLEGALPTFYNLAPVELSREVVRQTARRGKRLVNSIAFMLLK